MEIGCLTPSVSRNAGGLFESVRHLACSLSESNPITVFSVEDEFTSTDIAEWRPLTVKTFPRKFFHRWGYSPRLKEALLRVDRDILLVHGLWTYLSVASLAWHRRTSRPYIVHPHGMVDPWALRNSKWKKRVAARLYENRHLHKAACLRALCNAEAESIRDYGLQNPVCVIPNGVNLPDLKKNRAKPWREIGPNKKVLLYLGRLHPKKNLVPLLSAWAANKEEARRNEWSVVIAGWDQGGYQELLRRKARHFGIENDVCFPGPLFQLDKAAAYQNADAFVLPSLSEGLPMVVLEAWAFAKPVLMTPECNLPEGFASDAAIQIGTAPDTIAAGLRQLFRMSDAERIEMGAQGRTLASEGFAWPKIGEAMRRVCDWAVSGGSPPESVRFN